jgi:hypothetical protein
MRALAQSKGGQLAALRAQEIVEELEVPGITITNDFFHSTLMNNWAGQPDDGEQCGQILGQKSIPTPFAYNACITAWMQTKDPLRAGPEASSNVLLVEEYRQY